MENKEYRAWFENTRKSNQETIDQTEAIFEGLILKIASGAMAISFSFITALSTKIEYRFLWILAIGWTTLAVCIILNLLSHLKAKRNCRTNISDISSNLQFATFGRNITEIEDNAFYGCTSLRFITLGDCVETIGSYAFYGGTQTNTMKILTACVTLPASIKSIGNYAFRNRNIENVYCKSLIPPSLEGPNVFGNDWYFSGKCQYYVPMSAVDDYKKALYWKDLGDNIVGYDFK